MSVSALIFLLLLTGAAGVAWRRRAHAYAVAFAATAVLPGWALVTSLAWPAVVVLVGVLIVGAWHRWVRTSSTVTRWSARSRRKAGVASTLDIARHAGTLVHRLRAVTVRPSLSGLTRRQRWRLPTGAAAVELCRVGVQRVWASVEDVVLVFGGPRTGKSGWLAGRVLDAPGAVVVTSTRTDLLELCGPLRSQRGPVFVFNPVGLAGIPSSITFDPLTGCTNPVTAVERATDMVAATSEGGAGDRAYWEGQARRVLAALLHAAALGRLTMSDVLAWVADAERADREVPALLRRSGVQAFEQDAMQFTSTNDRTRTSITSTLMPALGWLTHPAASAAAAPGQGFDVEWLLARRATVFLLGAEEAQTGPLVCALTGHVAREARRLAVRYPSGRLDPSLTLALDEAALISPVPLENWTADMGGRGVTIIAAFQSRAQLLARYGPHKTATILNNTGAVELFGGTRDRDDLQFWSTLAGGGKERRNSGHQEQPGGGRWLRGHRGPRRSPFLFHPPPPPRRVHHHHRPPRSGRFAHGPQGAGALAGADREPAPREGRGHPPRHGARHRSRPYGLASPRRPRPPPVPAPLAARRTRPADAPRPPPSVHHHRLPRLEAGPMSTDDREPVRTDEIAAFARRLRDLSRGIAADSATTAEYESFLADRDARLARVTRDQHDQMTNTQDDVAESPGRGPLSTPVPDDKLVQGWIELPGGLPPDEDELEERRQQLARWHDHAAAGVHEDGDDAGWSR